MYSKIGHRKLKDLRKSEEAGSRGGEKTRGKWDLLIAANNKGVGTCEGGFILIKEMGGWKRRGWKKTARRWWRQEQTKTHGTLTNCERAKKLKPLKPWWKGQTV